MTGLTLGKFAPLHRGHQFLIETALKEVDRLIVVIYNCPEVTDVPLSVRAQWIRALYPSVVVIEAWDGPSDMGDTARIKSIQERYIFRILNGLKIDKFYSSEFYGDHMSKALQAENRIVDENRTAVPVSGTEIRKDPILYKSFIHPLVYRDLITNVVFMGAPSTGKTTLAERMAYEFSTYWMPEYGREYWDKHQVDKRLTKKQLVELAAGHLEREEEWLQKANKYLFTDTNAITTYLFSLYYHKSADPELLEMVNFCIPRYHVYILCDMDIPYDDTWDRSGDANRRVMQNMTLEFLDSRGIQYYTVSGCPDERMQKVKSILNKKCTSSKLELQEVT
jgi:NadR type nicotinamide-nucleotide adenylyltransferase